MFSASGRSSWESCGSIRSWALRASPGRLARRVEAVREGWREAGEASGVGLAARLRSARTMRWPTALEVILRSACTMDWESCGLAEGGVTRRKPATPRLSQKRAVGARSEGTEGAERTTRTRMPRRLA